MKFYPKKPFNIYLPENVRTWLQEYAKKTGATPSRIIEVMIDALRDHTTTRGGRGLWDFGIRIPTTEQALQQMVGGMNDAEVERLGEIVRARLALRERRARVHPFPAECRKSVFCEHACAFFRSGRGSDPETCALMDRDGMKFNALNVQMNLRESNTRCPNFRALVTPTDDEEFIIWVENTGATSPDLERLVEQASDKELIAAFQMFQDRKRAKTALRKLDVEARLRGLDPLLPGAFSSSI